MRAEAAARRAEARKLAEQEQQQLEKAARKPNPKESRVTAAELAKRREEEQQRLAWEAEAAKKRQSRMADEEEYERMVLVNNTNRDDSVIEAHSVDEALTKMTIAEPALAPDRHPERRLKATFKAFEEAELPKLKEEKPGLMLNQYKDMIWKIGRNPLITLSIRLLSE